eukprot:5771704-Prymnesium_polylepis.1
MCTVRNTVLLRLSQSLARPCTFTFPHALAYAWRPRAVGLCLTLHLGRDGVRRQAAHISRPTLDARVAILSPIRTPAVLDNPEVGA